MADLSDETLMAYADGELPFAERARVEALLANDPAGRARLAVFRATGKPLAGHFSKPMAEPVPQHLVDLVMGGSDGTAAARNALAAGGRRSGLSAVARRMIANSVPRLPMALAFSTVLLIGTGAGWYLRDAATRTPLQSQALIMREDGHLVAQGVLGRALETAPSGLKLTASDKLDVVTVAAARLTFKSNRQQFCRHYELTTTHGSTFGGIACRADDERWLVKVHFPVAGRQPANGRTVAAGSANSTVLDVLVDRMSDGDALGAADEAALIGKHWRP